MKNCQFFVYRRVRFQFCFLTSTFFHIKKYKKPTFEFETFVFNRRYENHREIPNTG